MTKDPRPSQAHGSLLLHGALDSTLWSLLWPALLGAFFQASFAALDTYYISGLGTAALAAMGAAMALDGMHTAIAAAMGTAISLIAAGQLGAKNRDEAQRFVLRALAIGLGVAAVWCALALALLGPLSHLLSVPPDAVPYFTSYLYIRLPSFVALLLMSNVGAALRATGDTRTPVVLAVGAGVLNAGLAPLLIYGVGPLPSGGMRGAAFSYLLSVCLGVAVSLWFLARRAGLLKLIGLAQLRPAGRSILKIALPVFASVFCYFVLRAAVMSLAGTMGPEIAAGVAAAVQLEMLGAVPAIAAGTVLPMFMGYNMGAKNPQRASDGVYSAVRLTVMCQASVFALLALSAPWLAHRYSADATVQHAFTWFLWIVPFSHIGLSTCNIVARGLVGMGRLQTSMRLTLGVTAATLPVHITLGTLFGYYGLLFSIVLTRSLSGAAAVGLYRRLLGELALSVRSIWERPTSPASVYTATLGR